MAKSGIDAFPWLWDRSQLYPGYASTISWLLHESKAEYNYNIEHVHILAGIMTSSISQLEKHGSLAASLSRTPNRICLE